MSKRFKLFLGISIFGVFFIIIGLVVFLGIYTESQNVTAIITVEGRKGTKISGNYVVDGVETVIDGEVPARFEVTGIKAYFTIQKDTPSGIMTVTYGELDPHNVNNTVRNMTCSALSNEPVYCGFSRDCSNGTNQYTFISKDPYEHHDCSF